LTFGRHVPIIADRYVDPEFGIGVLKISPGHDHNDYHIARKLGLPILNVMNKDGTLNDVAGLYRYIESSKTRLYHSGDKLASATVQSVLLYVFENILKLLHPLMPFVTEELWQAFPYRKQALMVTPWPATDLPKDLRSIKRFQNLQSLIRGIRNVRAEYSVEPAKRISTSVVATADVLGYISVSLQVHLFVTVYYIILLHCNLSSSSKQMYMHVLISGAVAI